MKTIRIISIDPGYERCGVAIIEKVYPSEKEVLVFSDCIRTSAKIPTNERLNLIGKGIDSLIKEYEPQYMAIEGLFFSTNQKTALLVAEARGVILYEAGKHGLEVKEYNPMQVKTAITGHGKSDKRAMMSMLPHLISIPKGNKKLDDEYDAIAVGLTFFAHERF